LRKPALGIVHNNETGNQALKQLSEAPSISVGIEESSVPALSGKPTAALHQEPCLTESPIAMDDPEVASAWPVGEGSQGLQGL